MTSTTTDKHVAFQSKEEAAKDQSLGVGGTVASALENGIGAVAQAGDAVLRHIPGTDEHALHECQKQIEKTGVDFSVADDIAFECGPVSHSNSRIPATDIPKKPHTADELAYGVDGPGKGTHISASGPPPKDVCHTADDRDFVKGEFVKPTPAPEKRRFVDPHTADGVGAEEKADTEAGAGDRSDVVHTADDLAYTGKEM